VDRQHKAEAEVHYVQYMPTLLNREAANEKLNVEVQTKRAQAIHKQTTEKERCVFLWIYRLGAKLWPCTVGICVLMFVFR
jgi:hypothetical protein